MATQQETNIKEGVNVKEPDMYDVVMLNDDFTTMDFVVMVLKSVFFHKDADARELMLNIHLQGSCIVGTFTLDIAKSKVQKATNMARESGFPLRIKLLQHK